MAAHHGNEGTVKVASNAVAEVTGWTYDENDIDVAQVATMGDTATSYLASGIKDGGGSIECLWDETDSTGQGALTPGSTVTLNLYPEGATTGDTYYTGSVVVDNVSRKGGVTGLVTISFTFKGPLTEGTV